MVHTFLQPCGSTIRASLIAVVVGALFFCCNPFALQCFCKHEIDKSVSLFVIFLHFLFVGCYSETGKLCLWCMPFFSFFPSFLGFFLVFFFLTAGTPGDSTNNFSETITGFSFSFPDSPACIDICLHIIVTLTDIFLCFKKYHRKDNGSPDSLDIFSDAMTSRKSVRSWPV